MRPLCVDLFSGLGGWSEGFIAEGYECVGFDIERHEYGDMKYPGHLVLQDVLTLHGRQFKDAAIIVASSPCQAYSYMAMPWTRAKQIARALRGEGDFPEGYEGYRTIAELNALFEAPKRIQREAIEAAGRFIPMIQENVRGAIPWVGRSAWNFGSYHLWGDVPALMPMTFRGTKTPGRSLSKDAPAKFGTHNMGSAEAIERELAEVNGTKNTGGSWFNIGSPGQKVTNQNPVAAMAKEGIKVEVGGPGGWFGGNTAHPLRAGSSKSSARKAASARIAKIPFPLASHIARVYRPSSSRSPSGTEGA